MKVGSIVVVKPFQVESDRAQYIKWLPIGDEKTPYMIRDLYEEIGYTWVRFEEGIIGYKAGYEVSLNSILLREVDPPESLQEIIKSLEPVMVNA